MMTKHIPNAITCLNLAAGCVAIVLAFQGQLHGAALFILAAAVLDFLDGLAARLLHAYSPMGKELDSLSDVVSFGVAPAMLLFVGLKTAALSTGASEAWAWMALLLPVASALRLAKFNLDERQSSVFLGLPTPANGLFWAFAMGYGLDQWLTSPPHPGFLLPIVLVFAGLMVAEVPMFSLKIKRLNAKENRPVYLFLLGCLPLIGLLGWSGLAACIAWYVLLALILPPSWK